MKLENNHPAEPQTPLTGEARQRDIALRQFRAHLHLAITARQTGRDQEFKALPGPKSLTYCRALAKLPGPTLTAELAQPIRAVLCQMQSVAAACEARLSGPDPAKSAADRRVLASLDQALAAIVGELTGFVKHRAAATTSTELLSQMFHGWLFDEGGQMMGSLLRQATEPAAEDREPDGSLAPGSLPDEFARDVFARVATLGCLEAAYPAHLRPAAECLPAWPLLAYRHDQPSPRVLERLNRLNLGAASPLDTRPNVTFDPESPMVKYLLPLLDRLAAMRAELGDAAFPSVETERKMLLHLWWRWPEPPPGESVLAPLRQARQLPDLTRSTVTTWTREVIVPLVLATDALDYSQCSEPAFQAIARDPQVTNPQTFQTCLSTAVEATLTQLLRPQE
jgi:hypothetical protein